jgi:hypothetical protein
MNNPDGLNPEGSLQEPLTATLAETVAFKELEAQSDIAESPDASSERDELSGWLGLVRARPLVPLAAAAALGFALAIVLRR